MIQFCKINTDYLPSSNNNRNANCSDCVQIPYKARAWSQYGYNASTTGETDSYTADVGRIGGYKQETRIGTYSLHVLPYIIKEIQYRQLIVHCIKIHIPYMINCMILITVYHCIHKHYLYKESFMVRVRVSERASEKCVVV